MPEKQTLFRPKTDRRRILLVEDEAINREMLEFCLADSYDVVSAETGAAALDIIRAQHESLSLVLLDLHLPDMHGLDILRCIRDHEDFGRLPVIVLTSDGDAEVDCLSLGAMDFIPKPYPRPEIILARIQRSVELSEDRDTLHWTERDALTGLYNKEFFYRYAVQLDARHRDEPTDAIVLNINHFHTINDRYGKSYGDEVLRQIGAKALELVQNSGGIVCRSEADTFLVYCPHRTDYGEILNALSVSLSDEGRSENRIRLRMGVYAEADKTLDIERRFDRAKLAADTCRGSLTRVIGVFDNSMREAELLSEQLIEDFPAAIRERQFRVYYQPKFDIRTDPPRLHSAEALVRWQHPTLGTVSPGTFVPLFEANGLIQALDHFVWTEAAAQVRRWRDRFGFVLPVSVNVSRVDLCDPDMVDKLTDILARSGLRPDELLLEITESAYTEDADEIVEKVRQLRALGFHIEMDDFGSGYSSLNMFTALPIDALKLDMKFIRSAFQEQRDTRLLDVMIQLAEAFELPTIAEGVETEEQLQALRRMGCDIVQGYYFSRPLPAQEFEAFLTK